MNRNHAVHIQITKDLAYAARPKDFDALYLGRHVQAEMQSQAAAGIIAGRAPYFVGLRPPARRDPDLRSDRTAIRPVAFETQDHPILLFTRALVPQQPRNVVQIDDGNVQVPVSVEVFKGSSAARHFRRDSRTRPGGNILERAIAQVAVDQPRLTILDAGRMAVNFRVDVPTG